LRVSKFLKSNNKSFSPNPDLSISGDLLIFTYRNCQ
jgi:hypothetical protein